MHPKLSPALALTLFAITSAAVPTPQPQLISLPPSEEPTAEHDSNDPLFALVESKLALPKSWHLNPAGLKSAEPEPELEPAPAPTSVPTPSLAPLSAPPQEESPSSGTTKSFLTIENILEEFHGRSRDDPMTLLSRRSPSPSRRRKEEVARLAAEAERQEAARLAAEAEERQREERERAEQLEAMNASGNSVQSEGEEGGKKSSMTAEEFDELFERYRGMHDVSIAKVSKDKGKNLRFGGYVDSIMAPPGRGRSSVDGQS